MIGLIKARVTEQSESEVISTKQNALKKLGVEGGLLAAMARHALKTPDLSLIATQLYRSDLTFLVLV